MGVYRQKINQDTVKNVKDQILKNGNFHKEKHEFLQKLLFFKIKIFTFFTVSWLIFCLYTPILPFWNSQSLIIKHMYVLRHNHKY